MLLFILLQAFGLLSYSLKMAASYFRLVENDYVLIVLLAICTSIAILPASLYIYNLQKSIKDMTESFRIIQKKHEKCCSPDKQHYCEAYFPDFQKFRENYRNINQTFVMAAILYQVAVFGFFFCMVNDIPFNNHLFSVVLSVPYIQWLLLLILLIVLATYVWPYLITLLKKQGRIQKVIHLALIVAAIFWLTTFQISEIVFLIIFVLIQQMGSILLRSWSSFLNKGAM